MIPGDRAPRRRRLTDDEQALWKGATREVAPLQRQPRREPASADEAQGVADNKSARRPVVAPPPKTPAKRPPPPIPPLAPLDRRSVQRVARGNIAIDDRIDLHGMTQRQAYAALRRFLHHTQAEGAKLVLVITGKGGRGEETERSERGVLRRIVPQWLALAEFRPYVVGFDAAGIRHGGEGALYVRLRRTRAR